MRLLLALLTTLLLAATVQAQVCGIVLADAKAERKYKKLLTEISGQKMLVCEPRTGIVLDREKGQITYSPERNEVFVANPADPAFVPYVIENGEKKPNGRLATVGINGKYIKRIYILMPNQSLMGLSREYKLRRAIVDELIRVRDEQPKGGAVWMSYQTKLLSAYDRLATWMNQTTYTVAAEKLQKEIGRQKKLSKGEALEARLQRALASVRIEKAPEELTKLSQEITGGEAHFELAESEHVRIIYDRRGCGPGLARELLEFAEKAIDGFRRDFVDPYLSEDFPDHIPDRPFVEFWFGPDDLGHHERFYTEYYGLEWGGNKEQRLAVRGATKRRDEPPEYLDYGKREDHNLMGVVSHRIGHVLAALHYNGNEGDMKQDWLEEAVAYYISFEYFARNDETCYAFKGSGDLYAGRKTAGDLGEVTILLGERYMYNQLALEKGRSIDALAPMTIYSMGDADLAKGWSFYDFIVRTGGKPAQVWLREACTLAREVGPRFTVPWRTRSAAIWGLSEADVFRELEGRWRKYAEAEQEAGL